MDVFFIFVGIVVVIALIRLSNAPGRSKGTGQDANSNWWYSGDGEGADVGGDADGGGFDGGGSDGGGDSSSGF